MMERAKTPPPALNLPNTQLLTPPPTGGPGKRIRFTCADGSDIPLSKHFAQSSNFEEFGLAEYTEVGQASDEVELSASETSSFRSRSSSLTTISDDSVTLSYKGNKNIVPKLVPPSENLTGTSTNCSTYIDPFPFEKLPLSVRNRVYDYLLVVPALICVRQKHTTYHHDKNAYLAIEQQNLLPGIAHAAAQLTVDGFKFRFSRFRSTNVSILQTSKKIYAETRAVLYGSNDFEIRCPSLEFNPPPNFKIRLFPSGCQGLVRNLNIRFRAFYPLQWLLYGGYAEIKDAYCSLATLTLIFELETARKGFAKLACKREGESWTSYVERLQRLLAAQFLAQDANAKMFPAWINFRVLFDGDRYDDVLDLHHVGIVGLTVSAGMLGTVASERAQEDALRMDIKRGLAEAFELVKK